MVEEEKRKRDNVLVYLLQLKRAYIYRSEGLFEWRAISSKNRRAT